MNKAAEANAIADKAIAGGHGASIEKLAEGIEASKAWKGCASATVAPGSSEGASGSCAPPGRRPRGARTDPVP